MKALRDDFCDLFRQEMAAILKEFKRQRSERKSRKALKTDQPPDPEENPPEKPLLDPLICHEPTYTTHQHSPSLTGSEDQADSRTNPFEEGGDDVILSSLVLSDNPHGRTDAQMDVPGGYTVDGPVENKTVACGEVLDVQIQPEGLTQTIPTDERQTYQQVIRGQPKAVTHDHPNRSTSSTLGRPKLPTADVSRTTHGHPTSSTRCPMTSLDPAPASPDHDPDRDPG